MSEYVRIKKISEDIRIPSKAVIELTYRCNNNCRHCWLRLPAHAASVERELSFFEIKKIVNDARGMGCREWVITGGEPMLHPEFYAITEYIQRNSSGVFLQTNGTLINPKTARLMRGNSVNTVAIYGATEDIHDHVTRAPGSFKAMMRGIRYLKKARTPFILQFMAIRDNIHQLAQVEHLAKTLGARFRHGSEELRLSAWRDPKINEEIVRQRISPEQVVSLAGVSEKSGVLSEAEPDQDEKAACLKEGFYYGCIKNTRTFSIDPFGHMTFCMFVKDSSLSCDLRKSTFRECWETVIPSMCGKVYPGAGFDKNCLSCELLEYCDWCPAYSYLEHGKHDEKIEYFCAIAKARRDAAIEWKERHIRYYRIAGITMRVHSDLPFTENTMAPSLKYFQVDGVGDDTINIRTHFYLPEINMKKLGERVYRKAPWAIYRKPGQWTYLYIPGEKGKKIMQAGVFSHDYTSATIYHETPFFFEQGNMTSLTMLPTDQIYITNLLADRQGCLIHSAGIILDGKGIMFIGHSGSGKSTIIRRVKDKAKILCDDRNIVRAYKEGYRLYGTWSHGEIKTVSSDSAPLRAIFFTKMADEDRVEKIYDKSLVAMALLDCVVTSLGLSDWWDKTISTINGISDDIEAYNLYFKKEGDLVDILNTYIN